MTETEYFSKGYWSFDPKTFEWYHWPSGLTAAELSLFIEHYES